MDTNMKPPDAAEMEAQQTRLVMTAIGRVANGVAHDINNLITPIVAYSRMVEDSLPADSPARTYLEQIMQAGDRLATLARQLYLLHPKRTGSRAEANLSLAVRDRLNQIRPQLAPGVQLTSELFEGEDWVRAEDDHIKQIVSALVSNAADAMPAGGVLAVDTAPLTVRPGQPIDGLPPGDYMRLSVRDQGGGIPPEIRTHLFEPFFTTKQKGKAKGWGLALVYGLLQQCGGHIACSSEPGAGTEMRVYFARLTDEPAAEKPVAPGRATAAGLGIVLIVDDDQMVRSLMAEMLKLSGYRVLEASGGKEARLVVDAFQDRIDLVIADLVMPGMDGRLVLEDLWHRRPGFHALLVSGYVDENLESTQVAGRTVPVLRKPFNQVGLAEAVRRALAQ